MTKVIILIETSHIMFCVNYTQIICTDEKDCFNLRKSYTYMNGGKIMKLVKWLVITPLAGVGALVVILLVAMEIESLLGGGGRTRTALSRMTSDVPYYEYGYGRYAQESERQLAVKMKTWDSSYQFIRWEDLAESILQGNRPDGDFGCVYKDRHKCLGCHENLMKVYYQSSPHSDGSATEGWLILCPNCRNQKEFKQIKQ